MSGKEAIHPWANEQCLICGIGRDVAKREKCYDDLVKDLLVRGRGLEESDHIWVEKKIAQWDETKK